MLALEGPRRNIAIPFGRVCGDLVVKKVDDMFSHFDRIPACDTQTDGHLATA